MESKEKATYKPVILVVGAGGAMGSALTRRLTESSYDVLGYDVRPPFNVTPVSELIARADVVILAIQYAAEQTLDASVRDALQGRIVVSITNPLTPELNDVITPHDESAAEHLADMLPGARVVKALNTISLPALKYAARPSSIETFVASNDRAAAEVVEQIIKDMGFTPRYVGDLILSRTLERMTALLIGIGMRYDLNGIIGWKIEETQ